VAALVAGHGSAKNPGARQPICAAVQSLRASGLFAEVRCALWKESPFWAGALDRFATPRVVVLPYFMAAGYYTDVVLPRELDVDRSERAVRLAPPLGTDPRLGEVVLDRARAAGFDGSQALAVLGHGTERNPASARTTFDRVRELQARAVAPEVFPVFIDQEPRVTRIFDLTPAREIVLVPYFAADGWHVTETLPADLGLQAGSCTRGERSLRVAAAVGSAPEVLPVLLDLARRAAGPWWNGGA
jgi:sirohydrochlorin cobaltochelatase